MSKLKTIKVIDLLEYLNAQLARTDDGMTTGGRASLCTTIEQILHRTGNYCGFNHLYWSKQGYREWNEAGKPEAYPEKNLYIRGGVDSEWKGCEYARRYYDSSFVRLSRPKGTENLLTKEKY